MKNFKKLLSVVLVLAMALTMVAALTGCTEADPNATGNATAPNAGDKKAVYTISVKSAGGMALADMDVYIYADSTLGDLEQFGKTNDEGMLTIEMPASDSYAFTLSAPKGYNVEQCYTFNGTSANITLTSSLVKGDSLSNAKLGLGDVMYDFSVVTPAGETVTLSEMLEEKELVLINFWYTTCSWCITEFPFMQQAYEQYQDNVGIIALDPFDPDTDIALFQSQQGLTFPMASCQPAWAAAFDVQGYPTSVFVDRYGVICAIEAGGITSLRPFTMTFDHFTGDDYEQKLCENGIGDLITVVKPNQTMPSSDEIAAVINSGDVTITYRGEEDPESAEMTWPFVLTEKNGEQCLKASNATVENSFAIIYADVQMKAGQALRFDYLSSTEAGGDYLYVIVNDEDIYAISGNDAVETWKACYPWVAQQDGTYELALCYLKDGDVNEGDDTVYIKNMCITDSSEINTPTYIPFNAATTEDGFEYSYVDIFLNKKDGYYHVGSENGPLLLADMTNYSEFSEEDTLWNLVYDDALKINGEVVYDKMVNYFSYASNSALNGVCTVNEELAEFLKKIVAEVGFNADDANEWLKFCRYYQAYGTNGVQLRDPIKGLATFSAYEAKLGKNVSTNVFEYDRIVMPRGYLAKFVPNKSGVYRITSRSEAEVNGWIFGENRTPLYEHEPNERMYSDEKNISMLYYMEAGKAYYIDIAFWDVYGTGKIYYDIEYVAKEYDVFSLCSQGYFTFDTDATGEAMYHTVAGGIDVVLNPKDGIYYEDLGKDAKGNQRYGSKIYADFTGITTLFGDPIATVKTKNSEGKTVEVTGMIDMGGFDFTKSETDHEILSYLKRYDYDVEQTEAFLRTYWGADFEANAEFYQIEDVFEGKYHGNGVDQTEDIKAFLDDIITTGPAERRGCVVVTEELADLLQKLLGKYTFENVDNSWTKLCYYYKHLGPNN